MTNLKTTLLSIFLLCTIILPFPNVSLAISPQAEPASLHEIPEQQTMQSWIEEMKQNPRGPFKRIRWFCNDGSILPPEPYACREHGGGVQHGEYTDRVKLLRQHGYLVGNLFADLSRESFFAREDWQDQLKQIILEQFMRETDNGWIFRHARYYRGAMQVEDENRQGHALLLGMLDRINPRERDFLLLREAARFLPHGHDTPPLIAMRQLSQEIAELDPAFKPMRIKLHSHPQTEDAEPVRQFAITGLPELRQDYLKLAELIIEVTTSQTDPFREAIKLQVSQDRQLIDSISSRSSSSTGLSAAVDFSRTSQLLVTIRENLDRQNNELVRLRWLELSLGLEDELYRTANQLLDNLPTASRRSRLAWIEQGIDALYGTGMLSKREHASLKDSLRFLYQRPLSVDGYHRELNQLAHLTRWVENRQRFLFEEQIGRLSQLDSAFRNYIPERLRASPLLPISRMIDSLQIDSQRLRGVKRVLFSKPVSGLQPLNPGIARGRLEIVENPRQHQFSRDGIYLLPETIEDLPPVAGILTRGAGNTLSHIQLLARNLGIPNIAISEQLLDNLRTQHGEMIQIAASPGGAVEISISGEDAVQPSGSTSSPANYLINPDLDKLNLDQTAILRLDLLKSSDSGRIAGPKGANLGELRQLYGDLVPDALVVPFGRFKSFLERTTAPDGQSLFGWMRDNYQRLAETHDTDATKLFLGELRERILTAPLDRDFIDELRTALDQSFGPDGSYGVFVRSDTNVEDLPNFTGAGLNKTVPHVVGFDKIVNAIRAVWASPFSERAYNWRQAHMQTPEHLYASVLLMLSVPADKSGVLATIDPTSGDTGYLHIAVNEGVGGAVSGQRAEELLIDRGTGDTRLLAQSSATSKRILDPDGGVRKRPAEAPDYLLNQDEIGILRQMAETLPARFPELSGPAGVNKPADIEFGFLDGRFVLFQIRPLVESKNAGRSQLLQKLDSELKNGSAKVDLQGTPVEAL